MKDLPDSEHAVVVRTDFSDEAAWARIRGEIEAPVGEFRRATIGSDLQRSADREAQPAGAHG
jgi:hypothetical protein